MGRRWEELEEDCLLRIFGMLALDDLILAIPFVCTSWFRTSLNPSLWRSVDLRGWDKLESRLVSPNPNNMVDKTKRSFTKFLYNVVIRSDRSMLSLHFPTNGVSIADVIFVSNKCPTLKFLMFPILNRQDRVILPTLVGRWKKLEYLCFICTPVDFTSIMREVGRNCENFKGLKVSSWLVTEAAKAIVTHTPNIKVLDLSGSLVSNYNLRLILEGCKELEELDLRHCQDLELDNETLSIAKRTVRCFKHELYQWGSFRYIDDKWRLNHTREELTSLMRLHMGFQTVNVPVPVPFL